MKLSFLVGALLMGAGNLQASSNLSNTQSLALGLDLAQETIALLKDDAKVEAICLSLGRATLPYDQTYPALRNSGDEVFNKVHQRVSGNIWHVRGFCGEFQDSESQRAGFLKKGDREGALKELQALTANTQKLIELLKKRN